MSSIIGFDGKEYHKGLRKDFFAPLGAGVEIFNYDQFKREYDVLMGELWGKFGGERKRKCYKSRHLRVLLKDASDDFMRAFIQGVKEHILSVNIFFTMIYPTKVPVVYSYGKHREQDPVNFMVTNNQAYPSWCAWKYLDINKYPETLLMLDNFQGERTVAWESIKRKKPDIYVRGDSCNPLISTADIIASMVDKICRTDRLTSKIIQRSLKELGLRGKDIFIGQPDFKYIIPLSEERIDTTSYLAHPLYFIISEDRPELLKKDEWREHHEYSAVMDSVVNAAFEANGAVKWYDQTEDYKILTAKDKLIFYGDKGKEVAEKIGSSYNVTTYHFPYDKIK